MANVSLGNPLSAAQLKLLNESIFLLNQAVDKLDKAEAAGIDVSAARADRNALYDKVIMIKATYFPNMP